MAKKIIIFLITIHTFFLMSFGESYPNNKYCLSPETHFKVEKQNPLMKMWIWIKAGLNISDRDISKMQKIDFFADKPNNYKFITDMNAGATKYSLLFVVGPYYQKYYNNVVAKRPNGNPNLPDYQWHLNVVHSLRNLTPKSELYPPSYRIIDGKSTKIGFLLIQRKIFPLMNYFTYLIQNDAPLPVLMKVIDSFMDLQKQLVLRRRIIDLDPKPLRNYGFNPTLNIVQIFDTSDLRYRVSNKMLPKEIESLIYSCGFFGNGGFKILKENVPVHKEALVNELNYYYLRMLEELYEYLLKNIDRRGTSYHISKSA